MEGGELKVKFACMIGLPFGVSRSKSGKEKTGEPL
jgi:hypothetical protein